MNINTKLLVNVRVFHLLKEAGEPSPCFQKYFTNIRDIDSVFNLNQLYLYHSSFQETYID